MIPRAVARRPLLLELLDDQTHEAAAPHRTPQVAAAPTTPANRFAALRRKSKPAINYVTPEEIDRCVVSTCDCLSALAAFAQTNPSDFAARIRYDDVIGKDLVPIDGQAPRPKFVVDFDGPWSDMPPAPQVASPASRGSIFDDVNSTPVHWQYAHVALPGNALSAGPGILGLNDDDKQLLEFAFHGQKTATPTLYGTRIGPRARPVAAGSAIDLRSPWEFDSRSDQDDLPIFMNASEPDDLSFSWGSSHSRSAALAAA